MIASSQDLILRAYYPLLFPDAPPDASLPGRSPMVVIQDEAIKRAFLTSSPSNEDALRLPGKSAFFWQYVLTRFQRVALRECNRLDTNACLG